MAVNYCFTLNNPTLDEESLIQVTIPEVSYIIYGNEVGDSGTPHLQGYLELTKRMSIKAVKQLLGVNRLHLEPRKGTQSQAIAYCRKDDPDPFERGTPKPCGRPKSAVPSSKNKLLPYVSEVKSSLSNFASHPDASFHMLKHAKEFLSLTESPRKRDCKPLVIWLYGPTGTGKTLRAFQHAERLGLEPYVKSGNAKWFDGYDCHKFVILDDFRDSHMEFGFLLRLLDRYPLRVECKGSSRQFKAEIIYITSPSPPDELYKVMQSTDKHDKIGQLLRRIDEVRHITKLPSPPASPAPVLSPSLPKLELITPPKSMYPVEMFSPFALTPNPRLSHTPPRRRLFDSQTPLNRCPARRSLPSPTQLWRHPESDSDSECKLIQ